MSQDHLTVVDGVRYLPATSEDVVSCANCGNDVDTPEELASYPSGSCPECGNSWTGTETKSTTNRVTVPAALGADTM